jgi:undecaprenyl-diphosphatase
MAIVTLHTYSMETLNRLNHFDQQLFAKLFRQCPRGEVITLARLLSRSGEGILHLLIPLVAWRLGLPGVEQLAALLLLSFTLERCLNWSLKNTLKRPRPQNSGMNIQSFSVAPNRFSFPSGHSSRAFLLASVLLIAYGAPALAMYGWAAGVALSRVILGVHYPGDILAGAVVGSATAAFSASLLGLL